MPQKQTAQVGNYDFGAPAGALASVLLFRVRRGGKLDLSFENPNGDADVNVSVEVSADNVSWNATTSSNNTAAITNTLVARRTSVEKTINLRDGLDLYVRVLAKGGARAAVQIRGDSLLDIVTV